MTEQITTEDLWIIRAAVERLYYEQDRMKAERAEQTKKVMYKIWDILDNK